MKRIGKRLAAVLCMIAAVAVLSGCGSEDKVGYVDMSRVQKEAPAVQQYQQKIEEKGKSLDAELQRKISRRNSSRHYRKSRYTPPVCSVSS